MKKSCFYWKYSFCCPFDSADWDGHTTYLPSPT